MSEAKVLGEVVYLPVMVSRRGLQYHKGRVVSKEGDDLYTLRFNKPIRFVRRVHRSEFMLRKEYLEFLKARDRKC